MRGKKRILMVLLCVLLLFPSAAAGASITLTELPFTAKAAAVRRKASSVKAGTSTITATKGFLKFRAKKTGTYAFTFSKLKKTGIVQSGLANIFTVSGRKLKLRTLSTKGGRSTDIWFATKPYYEKYSKGSPVTPYTLFPKRTALLKLKKGQTAYIFVDLTIIGNIGTYQVKLTIKRKK